MYAKLCLDFEKMDQLVAMEKLHLTRSAAGRHFI